MFTKSTWHTVNGNREASVGQLYQVFYYSKNLIGIQSSYMPSDFNVAFVIYGFVCCSSPWVPHVLYLKPGKRSVLGSLSTLLRWHLSFSLLSAHFSFTLNDRNAGKLVSGPPEAVCSAVTLCQPHLFMRSVCLSAQFQEKSLGTVNAVLEKSCPCKDIVFLSARKIKVNAVHGVKKNIYICT